VGSSHQGYGTVVGEGRLDIRGLLVARGSHHDEVAVLEEVFIAALDRESRPLPLSPVGIVRDVGLGVAEPYQLGEDALRPSVRPSEEDVQVSLYPPGLLDGVDRQNRSLILRSVKSDEASI